MNDLETAGVFVLGTCVCVPSFMAFRPIVVEKIPTRWFRFCDDWNFFKISSKFFKV